MTHIGSTIHRHAPETSYRPSWHADAACASTGYPDLWFDQPSTAASWCAECPVARQCADFAERLGEKFGVWGGVDREHLTPTQQKRKAAREARAA